MTDERSANPEIIGDPEKEAEFAELEAAVKLEDDIVTEAKDVFIIGYGSSGAGKTSTLINNKTLGKLGILLEFLNGPMFEGIDHLFVTVNELFAIDDEDPKSKKLTMKKNEFKNIKFTRVAGEFVIASGADDNKDLNGKYYENTREILPEAEIQK